MDIGRQYDLKELTEMRKNASNRQMAEKAEKIIYKIMAEHGETVKDREILIKAVRSGDRRAVHYYQSRLNKRSQDKSYGQEIG